MSRLILLAAALCAAGSAAAAVPAASNLSPEQRAAALAMIETTFQERYVFPDMRPRIVERLEQARKAGRYDVDDPVIFADRLTQDLRDVAHDLHLSLRVDPAAYAAALAPPKTEAGEAAFERRAAIRAHHGLAEQKILAGNVRYLRITGFHWVQDETGSAYDEAMRFLKDGDAAIIDLRGNGGGSHAAVRYLVSHFMDPEVLELTFLSTRAAPEQSWTLDHLPAGRLKGKPLSVLIDGDVASGAEAFAYDVQQFKLGELVGTKTAGAANNNERLPVAPNFMLSISYGRPEHAVSHTNWEGVGVSPDVQASSAQALDVAYGRTLDRLVKAATAGAGTGAAAEYAWARQGVEARLHPVSPKPEALAALAGRYDRYAVVARDGGLWMTWPKRADLRLIPMTAEGLFAVEGSDILRIRLTGNTLEVLWSDEAAPRVFRKG